MSAWWMDGLAAVGAFALLVAAGWLAVWMAAAVVLCLVGVAH